jgi:hypothetical protein
MTLPTKSIPLDQLHFDMENPRYGNWGAGVKTDTDALDMIVSEFLVDDLLSSISANGFFEGEPLIVRKKGPENYTVVEGNRRLASLLILSNDSRAASQQKRTKIYKEKLDEHKQTCPTEVPAIVLEANESWNEVLAYLGTKHIVGPSQWDSYAKARWMAEMRRTTNMALKQIKEMIGDTQGLVDRMLEGFYVVEQAKAAAVFDPEQSYQRGRGSNPEFPFSWVYTALNLSGVRKFLGLDSKGEPAVEPLKPEMVKEAGDFLTMVFGNRSLEKKPVIKESRDIAKLSNALTSAAKSARLRDGTPLEVVEEEGRPMAERLNLLVGEVQERLSKANGLVSEGGLTIEDARALEEPSVRVFTASKALRDGIRKAREKGEDGDE